MTRAGLPLFACALLATAPARSDHIQRTPVEATLLGIDSLPDENTLMLALAGNLTNLVQLAEAPPDGDPGLRIRAYRSLGLFASDVARAGLEAAVAQFISSTVALDQLYLIAAIEGLGEHGGAHAVPQLTVALNHRSRDVRAAAATALGKTQALEACAPLQERGRRETVEQVKSTIRNAQASLDICGLGAVR